MIRQRKEFEWTIDGGQCQDTEAISILIICTCCMPPAVQTWYGVRAVCLLQYRHGMVYVLCCTSPFQHSSWWHLTFHEIYREVLGFWWCIMMLLIGLVWMFVVCWSVAVSVRSVFVLLSMMRYFMSIPSLPLDDRTACFYTALSVCYRSMTLFRIECSHLSVCQTSLKSSSQHQDTRKENFRLTKKDFKLQLRENW